MNPRADSEPRGRARAGGEAADRQLWPLPSAAWLPASTVALIFSAHWSFGALVSDVALIMAMGSALLLGAVLMHAGLRDDLLRLRGLSVAAALFGSVLAVAVWTLTPYTPGGPHPVWGFVGVGPGASTIDKSSTLVEVIKLMGLGCLFAVGAATGAQDDRAKYALRFVLAMGVVFGLWAFVRFATDPQPSAGVRRLEAHFLNPNTAGTVFAVLLMLALASLVQQLRLQSRGGQVSPLFPILAAVLTFASCLLASASRGAMTAFLAATLVFIGVQIATKRLRFSRALLTLVIGLLALAGLAGFAGDELIERFFQADGGAAIRAATWELHWTRFLESPLFGYGLGTFETINKTLLSPSTFEVLWTARSALNLYLQWLEEAGLAGAIPAFACVAFLIASTLGRTLGRSRMTTTLASLLAADAIFLLHGATDFALQTPSVAAFFAWILGLQFGLAQAGSRR